MLRRARPLRGQAFTEFIIVLPGVLLCTLLIWEFAYFWWARTIVSTATFEGARQVAVGRSPQEGHAVFNSILATGLGQMSTQREFSRPFRLEVDRQRRSIQGTTRVPYRWPTGLGALMSGGMDLDLQASAFFRLEEFYPGPPDTFE
ncbi:MAG TPA: pilus assembly protein [Anaerolineae bacterium]|nr:pilus assembly protein [Anaerolineae bacterium]